MEKIVKKIKLKEEKSDWEYWQTQSYEKRLETVEKIRQEYHQWLEPYAESRLQRVYTISHFIYFCKICQLVFFNINTIAI